MCELRAIVFDLDDTLYPERAFVLSGFRAVAHWVEKQLGVPGEEVLSELFQLFKSGVRGNTFDLWLEGRGFKPKELVSQMVAVYREHQPDIMPYPGVPDLLARLRSSFRLGLLTDGYMEVQKRKLAALGLERFFDAVIFTDKWGKEAWKPNAYPFKVILNSLGVLGCEALYIGDNPKKDFFGAKQLGMWTTRIRFPDGLYVFLEPASDEYAPHFEVKDFEGIQIVLEQISKGSGSK